MTGRNLLAMTCSGLALLAAAGCAHDVPRGSIKDTAVAEPAAAPARTRVRGYEKRPVPKRPVVAAAPDREEKTTTNVEAVPRAVPEPKSAAVPAAKTGAEPPTRAVEAPRVVNPAPKAAEPPRVVNPAPKAEPPSMKEAAAGNAAGPGAAAVPGVNGNASLTQRIMDQARQRIAAGDVVRAREWLLSAINGARPEVLHELGRTFDPNYLNRIAQPNAVPEPARARALYEEAARLGAKGASEDLAQLLKSIGQP